MTRDKVTKIFYIELTISTTERIPALYHKYCLSLDSIIHGSVSNLGDCGYNSMNAGNFFFLQEHTL